MAANSMTNLVFGEGAAQGATMGDLFSSGGDGLLSNIDWSWITGGSGGGETDFSGWENYDYYADGGVIKGGSGRRDDVFLGKVNGKKIMAKGGEYIMPPEQTAKYYPILESMREGGQELGFADGGSTSGRRATTGRGGGSGMLAALAALSARGYSSAEAMSLLSQHVSMLGESSGEAAAITSEATTATQSLSQAKTEAAAKTKDWSDATIGYIGGLVSSKTQAIATGAAVAGLTALMGPLGAVIGFVGAQAIAGTDASKALGAAWGEAVASAQAAFNELQSIVGFAEETAANMSSYNDKGFSNYGGDLYGESVDPQSYEVNSQSGGGSSSSGGTTGSVGSDGMGFNGESGEESGWAKGGIVNRLMVPRGDDGFGALRLGEGVIDVDTMKILSSSIRSGKFPRSNKSGSSASGGGQPTSITIPISIGNEALTTLVVSIADRHIDVRQRQGVTGRAYAR